MSKEEILKVLDKYGIVLDYDTILDFNIEKKIVQYQDLFSEDIKRKNS